MNAKEIERYERKEELRWLDRYYKAVVGLAALSDMYAEGNAHEWCAIWSGLDALAKIMQEDIDARKKELEK